MRVSRDLVDVLLYFRSFQLSGRTQDIGPHIGCNKGHTTPPSISNKNIGASQLVEVTLLYSNNIILCMVWWGIPEVDNRLAIQLK